MIKIITTIMLFIIMLVIFYSIIYPAYYFDKIKIKIKKYIDKIF